MHPAALLRAVALAACFAVLIAYLAERLHG